MERQMKEEFRKFVFVVRMKKKKDLLFQLAKYTNT